MEDKNEELKVTDKPYYNEKKNDKKQYRGVTKFEYQLLWTGLWFVFIIGLCAMFESLGPLWLLILWFFGSKW